MLAPSEAVWVPVEVSGPPPAGEAQQVVLATDQTALDTVPGLWPNGAREGMLLVANLEEVDEPLECGTVVGEVVQGPTVTQVCGACAGVDTWLSESSRKCSQCGLQEPDHRKPACDICGAEAEQQYQLSYSGCSSCRPEGREIAAGVASSKDWDRAVLRSGTASADDHQRWWRNPS